MKKMILVISLLTFLSFTSSAWALGLNDITDPQGNFTDLGGILSALFPIILIVAGMVATLFVIYGGFRYMTAQGDPKALEAARGTITSAVVGLIIVLSIGVIGLLLASVLGFNIFTGGP